MIIHLDKIMLENKINSKELANKIGITEANLSKLKTGKIKELRLTTLNSICEILNCQPKDILEYKYDFKDDEKF